MRIQHNITALNANRNLTNNNSAVSKSLEKLSSGYRINRAGDDAAGLAISEKMRAQITGLETAQKNAQDGISLVQTAEGALTEVHSMLNRMVELATQSANGTYATEDRANLQAEINALNEEIDRIAETTNFNGISLLDGSLDDSVQTIKGVTEFSSNVAITSAAATAASTAVGEGATAVITAGALAAGDSVTVGFNYTDNGVAKSVEAELEVVSISQADIDAGATGAVGELMLKGADGDFYALDNTDATSVGTAVTDALNKELDKELNGKFTTSEYVTFGADAMVDINALTSKETGTDGVEATGITVKGNDGGTVVNNAVAAGTLTAGADKTGTIAAASFKVMGDVTAANATNTFEDSVFEVDGERFVFVEAGTSAEKLKEIESGVHIIQMAAAGTAPATADLTSFANKAEALTGTEFTVNGTDISFSQEAVTKTSSGKSLTLQVGDTNESSQKVTVAVQDMSSAALGLEGLDISTEEGAGKAIDLIKAAISTVSTTRGALGAIQNRVEHTINNLSVTTENMTAAESRIRDVDMATEMMEYTKNNILVQASQSMLAQANQTPQGILQLLQ